jgi:hypothetical protein
MIKGWQAPLPPADSTSRVEDGLFAPTDHRSRSDRPRRGPGGALPSNRCSASRASMPRDPDPEVARFSSSLRASGLSASRSNTSTLRIIPLNGLRSRSRSRSRSNGTATAGRSTSAWTARYAAGQSGPLRADQSASGVVSVGGTPLGRVCQTRTVPSIPPEISIRPSRENERARTVP